MTQHNKILKAMLDNPGKKFWIASDFQKGNNFVGYEASARMSELLIKYKDILVSGRDGRFRTLSIDWNKEKEIKQIREILELEAQNE